MHKGYTKKGLADYRIGIYWHDASQRWLLFIKRKDGRQRVIGRWHKRGDGVNAVDRWATQIDEIILEVLDEQTKG